MAIYVPTAQLYKDEQRKGLKGNGVGEQNSKESMEYGRKEVVNSNSWERRVN